MLIRIGCVVAVLAVASGVQAQTVIGPSSLFQWDVAVPTVAAAQALTYQASIDTAAPLTLLNVSCVVGVPPAAAGSQTCGIPASQIPLGSHAITLTASNGVPGGVGVVTSLPSTPLQYIDFVIPVPAGLRFK